MKIVNKIVFLFINGEYDTCGKYANNYIKMKMFEYIKK